ncbi:VCBS repeat-containing protein [Streptomyces atrovirens]|uniref:VCBS repeat-containing protein n=1 Tax=Streptomyces atrovirens TaxID=285556 RepID=A0ABW0DN87_9ACTN
MTLRRSITAACCVATLLLAGCSSDRDSGAQDRKQQRSPSPAVVAPTATGPVPQGKGGRLPDDINGDGYRDLELDHRRALLGVPSGLRDSTTFLFGSPTGLRPTVRTALTPDSLGLPEPSGQPDAVGIGSLTTADLDGDGFPEFITRVPLAKDPAVEERYGVGPKLVLHIAWGTPAGHPRPGTEATRLPVPGIAAQLGVNGLPAVGDFDGDGQHDLAVTSGLDGSDTAPLELSVLYGPFDRGGRAARTQSLPIPNRPYGRPIAAPVVPGQVSDLVLKFSDSGEQSGGLLFEAGPDGLRAPGRELRAGNGMAFGDFDGDGRRDVAVADNGSRPMEDGETEPAAPEVDQMVTVYFHGRDRVLDFRLPGIFGPSLAADTDGDGRDELAAQVRVDPDAACCELRTELLTLTPSGIESRRTLSRTGPPVRGTTHADLYAAGDFSADGRDELVFALGLRPTSHEPTFEGTRWWVVEGDGRDQIVFTGDPFADRPSADDDGGSEDSE